MACPSSAEERVLHHVALIADGNRRWAKEKGLAPTEGHVEGFTKVAPRLIDDLFQLGVHTVTLWCSSIKNLEREPAEVENYLRCFEILAKNLTRSAKDKAMRIVHMGNKSLLPISLRETLEKAERLTKNYTGHVVNLAIAYSGSDEICRAHQKIGSEKLSEDALFEALDTSGQPYPSPDLVIRTAGEQRLGAFMPLQTVYSELYFVKTYFPAVTKEDLVEAVSDFGKRKRTFSK